MSDEPNNSTSNTEENFTGNEIYVDLGLPSGTLWATYNLGAEKPEEIGGYFAWGETKTNTEYSWSTYKYGSSSSKITKYNKEDGITVLTPEDDAATVNLGSEWRIPTKDEWQELKDECAWKYTNNYNNTNVAGRIVYKKKISGSYTLNDVHIFLPHSGEYDYSTRYYSSEGYYWSSSLSETYTSQAYCINFWGSYDDGIKPQTSNYRCYGMPIRPVRNK